MVCPQASYTLTPDFTSPEKVLLALSQGVRMSLPLPRCPSPTQSDVSAAITLLDNSMDSHCKQLIMRRAYSKDAMCAMTQNLNFDDDPIEEEYFRSHMMDEQSPELQDSGFIEKSHDQKKRKRRRFDEISRIYACSHGSCKKVTFLLFET